MIPRLLSALLVVILVGEPRADADDVSTDQLVFSVRTWAGDYSSRDIPGGVESTTVDSAAIYTIRADGSGLTRVAAPGKNSDAPNFTPDGKWIYFQSNATGVYCGYRVLSTGQADEKPEIAFDASRLGPDWSQAYGFSFSRDGSQLLFSAGGKDGARIALANIDGSMPRLVAPKLGYLYMTALAPAGDFVACSGPASGYRLKLIRLADDSVLDLTPKHPDSYAPQFTPDGRTIVFVRRDGDIYRVDVDGTNLRRLTEGNRYVEFRLSSHDKHGSTDGPHISPDGRKIGYIALREGIPSVCTMNLDGTEPRTIVTRSVACGRFRWSPDGSRVAFVSFVGKYPQLFVADADGQNVKQVTTLDAAVGFPQWKLAR